jgi:two-component system alkaline phosphatase synthesis response regulator PhoP
MGQTAPELILLDIMLPEEDGLSVLKKLRSGAATKDIPVIMLTAKDSEYDKVVGLDAGADDYVPKPFGMMELLSRIRALLRRTAPQSGALRFGDLEADPDRHRVTAAGAEIALTQKEFELLCLLLRSPGTVFTREQLLSSVWGYEYAGETRTVDAHVRTLRQKLGDAGRYIETVRGYGYRLGEGA